MVIFFLVSHAVITSVLPVKPSFYLIYFCNLFNFQSATAFQESRLQMGYSFSLGLGFLIGASILKTTIAPKWNDIGQLAAIIAIRTVLNYLLLQAITNSSEPLEKSPDSQDVDNSKLVGSVDR
ncbi:DUF1622 domain-containing protein [Coleofasciculus sp. G2-EDA-02]|uniref:DUF1622 domain-containing protein n=1 Tax=Coleofasciculus sp. G2-EDA-02 TaxID=3069529 RepID=UPI0040628FCF